MSLLGGGASESMDCKDVMTHYVLQYDIVTCIIYSLRNVHGIVDASSDAAVTARGARSPSIVRDVLLQKGFSSTGSCSKGCPCVVRPRHQDVAHLLGELPPLHAEFAGGRHFLYC